MSDIAYLFITLFVLIAAGVPIAIAIGASTMVGCFLLDIPIITVAQNAYNGLEAIPLTTIPLFILAGAIMHRGGMTDRIVDIATACVGAFRGNLALITVAASAFFAALSGSGPATTAAIGSATIPQMKDAGYHRDFSGAVAAAGGALGSLIPPSNLIIIYCIVTNTSIPKSFIAAIVPGLLAALLLAVIAWGISIRKGYGVRGDAFSFDRLITALWRGSASLLAPLIILGGIFLGIFTPTEAAAVAVAYAFLVGTLLYRQLTMRALLESLTFTVKVTAAIMILLALSRGFAEVLTLMDAPGVIGDWLIAFGGSYVGVMLLILAVFIVTGTFMESAAQVVLFVPIFLPVITSYGLDPIVFGLMVVLTCEIGFLTPPVGANLFVAMRISGSSLEGISLHAIPYVLAFLAVVLILLAFPSIGLIGV